MIVLHNSHDKESRDFVRAYAPRLGAYVAGVATNGKDTVFDWYMGGREAWWAISGTDEVSAFPSVVIDIPEYDEDVKDADGAAVGSRTIPARQEVLRKALDIQAVDDRLAEINTMLDRSVVIGKTPLMMTLTRSTINDAETGRL